MIKLQTLDSPKLATPTEATLIESEPDTQATVHDKPSVNKDTLMSRHKAIECHDNEKLNNDWNDKVELFDKYGGFRKQFMGMFTEFYSMWDGKLVQVNISKYRIEHTPENNQPIQSVRIGMAESFKK